MLVKCLPVGNMEENCYVVTNEVSLECVVVDPGDESNTILDYIEDNKLKLQGILLTHGHFDHTGAVKTIMRETGAPLWMHRADAVPVGSRDMYRFAAPDGTNFVEDGDVVALAGMNFKVVGTPGHTPGSVCYVSQGVLFSGDTLFHGSCGRADLPGGDMAQELDSLRKLAELPGDYEVWPGHMDPTTMDAERGSNYYMRYALGK